MTQTLKRSDLSRSRPCLTCGIPLDSEFFDESRIENTPAIGQAVVLARFELPPQYCGLLQYFSQFTDLQSKDLSKVRTPGLQWTILSNNRPLYPYLALEWIVNPWGFGSFPVSIRLDDSATVEFVVRNLNYDLTTATDRIEVVGGRLLGRYWYNAMYGDVAR